MTYTNAHKAGPVGIRELEGYANELQAIRDKLTAMFTALEKRGAIYELDCDGVTDGLGLALDHISDAQGFIGHALGEIDDPDEDYDPKAEHGFGKAQYGLTR